MPESKFPAGNLNDYNKARSGTNFATQTGDWVIEVCETQPLTFKLH